MGPGAAPRSRQSYPDHDHPEDCVRLGGRRRSWPIWTVTMLAGPGARTVCRVDESVSATGLAIDLLADDVSVAGVAGGLLDDGEQRPA